MFASALSLGHLVIVIVLFLTLTVVGTYLVKKIPSSNIRFLRPIEYLPQDEIHTLRQVLYLALMAMCFINVLYSLIYAYSSDLIYFTIFDCILSLYIAITIDKSTPRRKILILLLIPYGSLAYVMFGISLVGILDLIHVPVFLYFVKYYYDKFTEYTTSNGLGITIILLFSIVFFSFLLTTYVEGKNPLDALVMVSNAFTSNGYAVLGESIPGKINSLILVWGGFIISGVGTATLTAAILTRHFNKKFEKLEELIKSNNED